MTHTRNRSLAAAIGLAMAVALAPSEATADQTALSSGDSAAQIQQGRGLYEHLCSQCHGIDMVSPGTVAYDLREFPHDAKARFVDSVTHGKNNRMPPWGDMLTLKQIDELWAYVRSGGKS